MSRDHQLIQDFCRSVVNKNATTADDVLDIYFVAPHFREPEETGSRGIAINGKYVKHTESFLGWILPSGLESTWDNQVFISYGIAHDPGVAAHEMMHILTNGDDAVNQPEAMLFPNNVSAADIPRTGRRLQEATIQTARTVRPEGTDFMDQPGNRLQRAYSNP